MRVSAVLLLACVPALGATYERLVDEAKAVLRRHAPGEGEGARLDRMHDLLREAANVAPDRWEAFFYLGIVSCERAIWGWRRWEEQVHLDRAAGVPDDVAEMKRQGAVEFVQINLADAYAYFQAMERCMRRVGWKDPERVLFASACMKYGGREYLRAKGGAPGAIDDFKRLVGMGFERDLCLKQIARSYLEIGREHYFADRLEEAIANWREALKYAPTDTLRRVLATNIAGAYELDNAFGESEEVLRALIQEEPDRPGHWKNLGLVLGYQGRLREALHAYRRARELAIAQSGAFFFGILHGNAWLRAAAIHANLLERDGDMLLAWRLLLEYREMFGDDYNFSLQMGDVALAHGQYGLAWTYLQHAKKLQPSCPMAYQKLVDAAARMSLPAEERRARLEVAKEEYRVVRESYDATSESPTLQRLCGGLHEPGDVAVIGPSPRLDPDPLAGTSADDPPAWVREIALQREPFRPFDPVLDAPPAAPEDAPEDAPAEPDGAGGLALVGLCAAALLLAAGGVGLFFRRRAA